MAKKTNTGAKTKKASTTKATAKKTKKPNTKKSFFENWDDEPTFHSENIDDLDLVFDDEDYFFDEF